DPRTLSATAIARTFDVLRRGTARFEGGGDALRQMLLDKLLTQHAGEKRPVSPRGIVLRRGKAHGLVVGERAETLGSRAILCALPIAEFGDLFGAKRPRRLVQATRSICPAAYRCVVNLVIANAGIPEGMAPLSFVVIDPTKPLMGDNAFAVFVGEPDNEARVSVSVVANAAAPGDGENLDDIVARLRYRLVERLQEVMPFSGEHTLLVHSPNLARPPDGISVKQQAPVFPPEPLWTLGTPPVLGVTGLPYDTGVGNATAASAQNLPGLGIEGSFAAGWCAARLVCHAAGKKKDYLRNEVLE
ncbi:MAG: hypothetical protein V2A73_09705, partial [Pseudomonadota bacterium]